MAKKKKTQELTGEDLPEYRVPEKYRSRPIRVRLDGKWVSLGRDVILDGKPPQIKKMIREATPEQYVELARRGLYGIELV